MKALKHLVPCLFFVYLSSLFGIEASLACSMAPFNADKQYKAHQAQFEKLAAIAIGQEDFEKLNFSARNFDGNYIWTGPMCPEGSWVQADVVVRFQPNVFNPPSMPPSIPIPEIPNPNPDFDPPSMPPFEPVPDFPNPEDLRPEGDVHECQATVRVKRSQAGKVVSNFGNSEGYTKFEVEIVGETVCLSFIL